MATGAPGHLLIAAEGAEEDADQGRVYQLDLATERFTTLATPRDPDQVLQSGSKVLIVAHGDGEVRVLEGSQTHVWARGAPAVALAIVPAMEAALVVVNGHE